MRRFKRLITTVCCFATLAIPLSRTVVVTTAQATCGGIDGRVTTSEGWLIPAARISFFNKDTKQTTSVQTREDGQYTACLANGSYDVTATAPGFKTAKRKAVKVEAAVKSIIDFPMRRGKPVISQ